MERYPLTWPEGWKRTAPSQRTKGQFGKQAPTWTETNGRQHYGKQSISVVEATQRILSALRAMGVREGDAIISTFVAIRLDGLPYSNRPEPQDPGAAVYWKRANQTQCMAIDRYTRVADNLAAIAATLEAIRSIDRHGGAEILDRAFKGFTALPEHAGGTTWRQVMGFREGEKVYAEDIIERFRLLAKERHPDTPTGTNELFHELINARTQGLAEVGGASTGVGA